MTDGPRRADAFAGCRVLGHAWFETPDDAGWSSRRVWNHRMVLRCDRCGTARYDGIDARGDVGSRQYAYPDGYQYARGEAPSRSELRLAMLAPAAERRQRRAPAGEGGEGVEGDASGGEGGPDGGEDDRPPPVELAAVRGAA
jgi:hypothetical protein